MEKWLSLIRKYPWIDLFWFGFYRLRIKVMEVVSTLWFRGKCAAMRVSLGRRSRIWGKVLINRFPGSRINLGDDLRIVSSPYRYANNIFPQSKLRTMGPGASIEIGCGVGFNSISITARSQKISIGDYTMIGGNCQILDSDGHPLWPPEARWHYPGNEYDAPVNIGNHVFIGLNVIILKGVTVGDNSVIAAGSVVTGSIPANCMAGGVPAKVIKHYEDHQPVS